MSEIVNQSLQKIAKGTGIVFTGTIIGLLLGFISRVIIVRYTTQTEYGIYSLALVIISIFATISTLGLQEGSTRYIAYFRGKKEEKVFKCKDKISLGEENMGTKAIYEEGILKPIEKIALEEKEEIWIEIKKRRMKGILKVDPKIVDEVIENEELFE
ncbi:hypothetical protein ES705_41096 [subsurface metagenome]